MIKQQAKLLTKITVAIDSITIATAFFFAYYIRNASGGLAGVEHYRWILFLVLPVWYFLLDHFQLYASLRTNSLASVFFSVIKVHAIGALLISSAIYLIQPHGYSRRLFLGFILISLLLVFLERSLLKAFLCCIRRMGYNFRNILIVGCNGQARELAALIEENAGWGLKIAGFLTHGEDSLSQRTPGYPVLGELGDIVDTCTRYAIDEVVFCLPAEEMDAADEYWPVLEDMGLTVNMVLDFHASRTHRWELSYFNNRIPMMTFYCKPFDAGQLFLKRCLDIAGALVGLGLTALLFPFIALAIKMDSPGPLFFGQKRVRENGRLFRCWKFRSMYMDAEERKQELMHLNEMQGAIFKIRNDPRITPVGAFLRKTSLDELPQFWNVLRGEMSLVGTRPPTPDEVAKYEHWHRKRICIKPGITGMWQVSGRNRIQEFDQVARLDIEYIDKWSLWLDVKILLRTFLTVFALKGSY
jgi:exopolysaccharide biosynthesis polyprenyl glycosylphosphotransferase